MTLGHALDKGQQLLLGHLENTPQFNDRFTMLIYSQVNLCVDLTPHDLQCRRLLATEVTTRLITRLKSPHEAFSQVHRNIAQPGLLHSFQRLRTGEHVALDCVIFSDKMSVPGRAVSACERRART